MCRNFLILLILFIESASGFAQDFQLKSLKVYSGADQASFPLLDAADSTKNSITIEFDLQSSYIPSLNIIFRFCDSEWRPYENAFLINPGYNTQYNLLFERLPLRVRGARYHYKNQFPNNNVTFPFYGKWRFFIVDSQNPNLVYGEGKFYVISKEVRLQTIWEKGRVEGVLPELAELGRSINIRTRFTLPDSLFQSQVKSVEIVRNRMINYPITISRTIRQPDLFFEWNAANSFTFVAKNIRPGNEYRQTDIRSFDRFDQKIINAQIDAIETSNLSRRLMRDMNGGSELMNYRNENSDYAFVNFRLRPPDGITQPVFLVGSFNDWKVLPEYEMYDDNGLMNLRIELKRGIYDYQYVTGEFENGEIKNIDWYLLEGNFWETRNEFNIFLFYEATEKGGYDKIIGYYKIITGE